MFETTANVWNYVIGAYTVTWLGLIAYSVRLFVLNRRAATLVAEVEGDA